MQFTKKLMIHDDNCQCMCRRDKLFIKYIDIELANYLLTSTEEQQEISTHELWCEFHTNSQKT